MFFSSPELCSGWAIVITFCPSFVCPSVNTFKRPLLRSCWASFAQISCGASLGWGNKRLLKWSVHWQRWPPCPYMVKTFKNFLLQNQGCFGGLIFAQIIGSGRSTKIAKMMVLHWHLTFLRWGQVCFLMHLYRKKCWEFQTTSLKPLGQCCWNFKWSLFGAGEWKIVKIVAVH